jgi:hypothetical protein
VAVIRHHESSDDDDDDDDDDADDDDDDDAALTFSLPGPSVDNVRRSCGTSCTNERLRRIISPPPLPLPLPLPPQLPPGDSGAEPSFAGVIATGRSTPDRVRRLNGVADNDDGDADDDRDDDDDDVDDEGDDDEADDPYDDGESTHLYGDDDDDEDDDVDDETVERDGARCGEYSCTIASALKLSSSSS